MDLASGSNNWATEQKERSKATLNLQADSKNYQGILQPKNFPGLPKTWTSEWETFPSSDQQVDLFSVTHHPKEWTSHRVLAVFHGFGEHGGRYLHFPHYVQSSVGAVYCLDHRGHGRSGGIRGHVDRFDQYADDGALALSRLDSLLKQKFGKSEIHLLGHSMGGLIALRTLLQHQHLPIASATISAPLLGVKVPIPWAKKTAARVLSKVWGSFHMASEVDPQFLSHDAAVVETYAADRLVHKKITPRFFFELLQSMQDTLSRESGIGCPVQFMIPMQDRVVDAEISLQFFRNLKHRDKQLKTYSDFFHEPFNEIGKEQVFEDLNLWIKNHSKT